MKSHRIKTGLLWSLHALIVCVLVAIVGPVGVAGAFVKPTAYLNLQPVPGLFGTSYPVINTTTVTDLTTLTSKAREELWVRRIVLGADRIYQDNPFADNFTGRVDSAKPDPKQLKKAIVQLTETEKVAGNTINVPTVAGFGGPGVAGEGNRIGSEQKIIVGNFPVSIGRYWFGVGFTAVSRDETLIGGRLDQTINDGLRTLMAKKKSDDHMVRMLAAADTVTGARNLLLPEGVGLFSELKSADVLSTNMIALAGQVLPGLGGIPMDTTSDSGGSVGECFTLFAVDKSLTDLSVEPAYLNAQKDAGVRGEANRCFKGGFSMWDGHGIYRWINRDHANKGPVGSPLVARALLGAVETAGPTYVSTDTGLTVASGTIIHGGGYAWSSTDVPTPQYFEFFQNAPYTYFNGNTIAAVTGTTRHLIIINRDGTFGVWPYAVNNGNKITINGATLAVGPSGKRTSTYHRGAVIMQCNILGTVIGRSLFLGAEAVVCGAGSINGNKVDTQMGKRTEEHRNHDMDHAIGCEAVWGNAAVQRAGDNAYPNFLVLWHAVSVPGAPTIT